MYWSYNRQGLWQRPKAAISQWVETLCQPASCQLARGSGDLWLADTSLSAEASGWWRNMENVGEAVTHTREHTLCPDRTPHCAAGRQAKAAFDWWELLSVSWIPPPPPPPPPWLLSISFHRLTIILTSALSLSTSFSHFPWIFSTHIHPLKPYQRCWSLFTTYLMIMKKATWHTASFQPRHFTWQQCAHMRGDWLVNGLSLKKMSYTAPITCECCTTLGMITYKVWSY